MVNIVTSYDNTELLTPLIQTLVSRFPEINSVVNNINTKKADTAYGEWENTLSGQSYIEEKIGGLTFEVSSNSFFQTNTLQAEKLYEAILKGANLSGTETIFDLYSGIGTIALYLSRHAREVIGFEAVDTAVEDALRNSVRNGVGNGRFVRKNLEKRIQDTTLPEPDVIVADPPRAGLLGKAIDNILSYEAKK